MTHGVRAQEGPALPARPECLAPAAAAQHQEQMPPGAGLQCAGLWLWAVLLGAAPRLEQAAEVHHAVHAAFPIRQRGAPCAT